MLEQAEVQVNDANNYYAVLKGADPRAVHIRTILKAGNGDVIRAGVVDAGYTDTAKVEWLQSDGAGVTSEKTPDRRALYLDLGTNQRILSPVLPENRPRIDLMLACPRPLQLERILPVVGSMGVDTLVICKAAKVEKDYFGSHLFRQPAAMRAKLVEGLTQCGDTALPRLVIAKRLKPLLEDELDQLFPKDTCVRVVAHPTRTGEDALVLPAHRVQEIKPPAGCPPGEARMVVAVGPEGGWDEPFEINLLMQHGFQPVTLGPRVLRSDVAVTALLALAHDWVANLQDAACQQTLQGDSESPAQ